MGRFAAERDYDGWDGPHRRFHSGLTRHAGDRFSLMISQLIDQCSRFRRMRVARMWSDETELEHRLLLDACIARDVDRAVWQLTEHLSETAVALLRTVDADYPAEQLLAVIGQVERPADAPARVPQAFRSRCLRRHRNIAQLSESSRSFGRDLRRRRVLSRNVNNPGRRRRSMEPVAPT
jgi:hypothetical protein